ncbi:hypothetical protein V5O48_013235 [Marasmius crinis-equi]|uniref:FAD-binding PCMH-type domain-containing protein n=1 Tax=Marasmius crinis-equi TaxID=585013 RepID=A0ABR3F117_9AGAR
MASLSSSFLSQLGTLLSKDARILTDPNNNEFKELLRRWSDINKQIPGAIVLVATEEDVVNTVRFAVESQVPFVPKSGGHSFWSTIGSAGIIIDLSFFKGVKIDKEAKTVTVIGGTLIKEVNEAVFEQGLCVPLGTANSVGVIPQAIGGGLSILATLCGYTSDNILAARIVTAKGELVAVSNDSHPDLLYAIRGAGQFFGLVTSLTLRTHPLSVLRTPDATIYTGTIVFPIEKLDDVARVLIPMSASEDNPWAGLAMVAAPPPAFQTCFMILPIYFGTKEEAETFLEPLRALGPQMFDGKSVSYVRINDTFEPFCVKDGFKRFAGAGMSLEHFKRRAPTVFPKLLELFEELKRVAPDAGATGYGLEWNAYASPHKKGSEIKEEETAFAHKDAKAWMELLSWYTDPGSHSEVSRIEKQALDLAREGQALEYHSTYQNWTRTDPIEIRYRGKERLAKLKVLKKEWDPNGVFTRELL